MVQPLGQRFAWSMVSIYVYFDIHNCLAYTSVVEPWLRRAHDNPGAVHWIAQGSVRTKDAEEGRRYHHAIASLHVLMMKTYIQSPVGWPVDTRTESVRGIVPSMKDQTLAKYRPVDANSWRLARRSAWSDIY